MCLSVTEYEEFVKTSAEKYIVAFPIDHKLQEIIKDLSCDG